MIFYFSGTGNSQWVAKKLQIAFDGPLLSIATELQKEEKQLTYSLGENESVFFVFPVHSWGMPILVKRFIKRLSLKGYAGQSVYVVCTCGDECGYTSLLMQELLGKQGIRLTQSYSLIMPNNYILMKGFDVDSKEVEQEKLSKAPSRLEAIVEAIKTNAPAALYTMGTKPFLKSRIIYPLFTTFAVKKNAFEVMEVCNSCGLCAKICPTGAITLEDGVPEWKNNCVQCTACIHRCPMQAIEYGSQTWKKGRYRHPEI
ncbi:EFR1 family ferrodoxin [Parabacteroides sp. OttesenSCG-928-G07]|nr:EFR1 family ferrodoxin [Parabacteroides sp. OttesenSCG-928-G07]